jgi:uncharacterized protein (TIGR03435 family)
MGLMRHAWDLDNYEGMIVNALKKADPANRTGCKYTGAKGVGQVASQLSAWNCQNMSAAQLADWLPQVLQAQAWLDHPVIDESGIGGSWDFTLSFSAPQAFQANTALEPNGAISLFEAMENQLGPKLQTQQTPHARPRDRSHRTNAV